MEPSETASLFSSTYSADETPAMDEKSSMSAIAIAFRMAVLA